MTERMVLVSVFPDGRRLERTVQANHEWGSESTCDHCGIVKQCRDGLCERCYLVTQASAEEWSQR